MKINYRTVALSLVFISSAVILYPKVSHALTPLDLGNMLEKNIQKVDPWKFKCGNIQKKAEERVANFEKNRDKHYEIYVKLTDRLEAVINDYEDNYGFNVDKLKEDLTLLEGKVTEYNEDYADYLSKLNVIEGIDCDNNQTDLTNALKDAREVLKEVRKDVVDIKTFYWTTIRQDIKELKKQIIQDKEE